jgi:hypothetical protein
MSALFARREGKSRFLDSARSSAFADDPAALEMTMGKWAPGRPRAKWGAIRPAVKSQNPYPNVAKPE